MIYDCFTFFNEYTQLEIRLSELYSVVDKFVIVEATTTFSGEKKPLYFQQNKEKFNAYSNKIIHVVVNDMPKPLNGDRWPVEEFQRNCIIRGLSNCTDKDIILISDVDEIPSKENILKISEIYGKGLLSSFGFWFANKINYFGLKIPIVSKSNLFQRVLKKVLLLIQPNNRVIRFNMKHYEYYLNGFVMDQLRGTIALDYSTLKKWYNSNCHAARFSIKDSANTFISGGWHFSYLGGSEIIAKKIHSFAHSEFDTTEYTNLGYIEDRINRGENLFGKQGLNHTIKYVKIDNTWPTIVIEEPSKFIKYIK
jgi:beta-1,4-mannosyl-glycoprotein beta-1,4-N-acetylglucosaminyltransferase